MSPIIASDTGGNFRPPPEGLYNAVVVDVVDHGIQQTQFGPKHKLVSGSSWMRSIQIPGSGSWSPGATGCR